jgi:HSP20 family protein
MADLRNPASARRDDTCELVITAKLPGVDEKDVDVAVSGDTLTIKAERKVEHQGKGGDERHPDRRAEPFARSVRLPFEVSDEEINATFDEGVLTVRVQKLTEAPNTPIEVKRIHKGLNQG